MTHLSQVFFLFDFEYVKTRRGMLFILAIGMKDSSVWQETLGFYNSLLESFENS